MRIFSVTLKNFHCFGSEPCTIQLKDITALIGNNGTGKTAVLLALSKLFGISAKERRIIPEDFHVPAGKGLQDFSEIELSIEVKIDFPELQAGSATELNAIPQCFNQMIVSEEGESPFCRIRLDAKWLRGNLPEGIIEESTCWITTADDDAKDDQKVPMPNYARSMIHVIYVPAFRDAARQLSQATGSLVYRLFRAIEWSDSTKDAVKSSALSIRTSVHDERSIQHIHDCLAESWNSLQDIPTFKNVVFQPVGSAFDKILQQVEAVFSSGSDTSEHSIERLSDGLKSLFYFALVSSVYTVEEHVKAQQASLIKNLGNQEEEQQENEEHLPISFEELKPPALTLFAIEEPENHLAPHYLGRILSLLHSIAETVSGQVIVTSHSPSILARIDPENVIYLRVDAKTHVSSARSIRLPKQEDAAFKFVKEAVRAYPELYFARAVVLGEGDSEEIVIPRLAKAFDVSIDRSFVSVVPLGGRHVNHFWRLLRSLEIPHLTLLDFDRERPNAGWARIHYALNQLIENGVAKDELLLIDEETGETLSDEDFQKMPEWDVQNLQLVEGWVNFLERYGVYFSFPLDLDFSMLKTFPFAYQTTSGSKPRIPKKELPEYAERIQAACTATLKGGNTVGSTYTDSEKALFIWYSHLFIGKGKPITHLLALNQISDDALRQNSPQVLKSLVEAIKDII